MLPFHGWISRLGLLVILLLACDQASAQQDLVILRLLVLGSDAQPVSPARLVGVHDAAIPALSTPAARRLTATFIGCPIDDALLSEIRDRLIGYYVSNGRPFIVVVIPPQDVATGTLRVNVTEMKRGNVRVEGNRWFSDQQYIGAIRTQPGDAINTKSLATDTGWINRKDHRYATIAVEPGVDPSRYDLIVRAKDSLPLDVSLAANNTGTADTGLYRIGLVVDWSNALWRGDDLDYAVLTGPDRFRLIENALSYTAYLPWRDWMTISVVDADTHGQTTTSSSGYSVNGHADVVSFRYSLSFAGTLEFIHHIDVGYDFKTTNSNVLTGGSAVFPTASELDQFVVAYSARSSDALGLMNMTAALVGSPGHLTPLNTDAELAQQQPGASASYVYGRVALERLTKLPLDGIWSARLTGQYSSGNLLSSEQLVFGGIRSIRGFMELGALRDEGFVVQHELRPSPVVLNLSLYNNATIGPFVFLDLGVGRNHQDMPGFQRSWL